MTTTAAPTTDIFSAWDQFDTDAPFAPTVEAPAVVTCKSCGRKITAAKSIAQGRGKACQAKHDARVAEAAKTEPADRLTKAIELIEDGGMARVGHLFLAMSSRGDQCYEVSETGECSCPAAQHGRTCYHALAARIAA